MPSYTSLYINPDIIGGGIKLKLQTLIEAGVPFISSVFGFEGYSHSIIDNRYIIVEEEANWVKKLLNLSNNIIIALGLKCLIFYSID